MLDVHPAHHAASTWRDFLIHIATIVLGLLIAIGLEQSVEAIHRDHQVREARAMLREELDRNRNHADENGTNLDAHLAQLCEGLAVIARVRVHESVPGEQILFIRPSEPLQSAAWQTVHASNVSEHMDPREVAAYGSLYQTQQTINTMSDAASEQLQSSLSFLVATEDPHIQTTAQIKEIESHDDSADSRAKAVRLLSHDNHPERLTPTQLDAVEQGIRQGIAADRRLQRWLAALSRDYGRFDGGETLR
jgi:hypothetical protein